MKFFFMTPLVIILIVMLVFTAKLLESDSREPSKLLGKEVPEFNLTDLHNPDEAFLSTELKGKYSLINIYGSWCISCRFEHPVLSYINENNILPIYGIAWKDKPENTIAWLEKHGNPYFKTGVDEDGQTAINFGVSGAPESYLISPNGIVVYSYSGPITKEILNNEILPLVKEK